MITRDPLPGVNGKPDVANPYAYGHNDPLNRVDPLGLRSTDAVFNVPNPCDPGPVTTEGQDYCNRYWPQDAASIIGYCGSSSVDWCFGWIGMSKYRPQYQQQCGAACPNNPAPNPTEDPYDKYKDSIRPENQELARSMEKDWLFMSDFQRRNLTDSMGAGYSCLAGKKKEDCWADLVLQTDIVSGLVLTGLEAARDYAYSAGAELGEMVTVAVNPALIVTFGVITTLVKQLTKAFDCTTATLGGGPPGILIMLDSGIPPCEFIPADELQS